MWNIRTYIVKWKRNLLSIPRNNEKKTLSFIFSTFSFCTYTICESMLIYFSAPTREHTLCSHWRYGIYVQYAWDSRWHFSCVLTNNDRRTVKGLQLTAQNWINHTQIRELHASSIGIEVSLLYVCARLHKSWYYSVLFDCLNAPIKLTDSKIFYTAIFTLLFHNEACKLTSHSTYEHFFHFCIRCLQFSMCFHTFFALSTNSREFSVWRCARST